MLLALREVITLKDAAASAAPINGIYWLYLFSKSLPLRTQHVPHAMSPKANKLSRPTPPWWSRLWPVGYPESLMPGCTWPHGSGQWDSVQGSNIHRGWKHRCQWLQGPGKGPSKYPWNNSEDKEVSVDRASVAGSHPCSDTWLLGDSG